MSHPVTNYVSHHFPYLEHPAYQSTLEIVMFFLVTTMLVGAFAFALLMLVYAM